MLSYINMETIVNPLDSINLKYNLEKVNNPEKFTKLLIKNYNKDGSRFVSPILK